MPLNTVTLLNDLSWALSSAQLDASMKYNQSDTPVQVKKWEWPVLAPLLSDGGQHFGHLEHTFVGYFFWQHLAQNMFGRKLRLGPVVWLRIHFTLAWELFGKEWSQLSCCAKRQNKKRRKKASMIELYRVGGDGVLVRIPTAKHSHWHLTCDKCLSLKIHT